MLRPVAEIAASTLASDHEERCRGGDSRARTHSRSPSFRARQPFVLCWFSASVTIQAHNFLLKRECCRFAQAIGITSDPRITFPYLLKICASKLGLCRRPLVPERRRHHSTFHRPHRRPRPDQTLVEPAAP